VVTAEQIQAALSAGLRGAQVPVPPYNPSGRVVASTPVFAMSLPDGATTPVTIVAGPLRANSSTQLLGVDVPAGLLLEFGAGYGLVSCTVDLPAAGTVVQLPPSQIVRATALVTSPPVDVPSAGWVVYGADGQVNAPPPAVTSPPKSIAALGSAIYLRQSLAIAYRLLAPVANLAVDGVSVTQENDSGVLSIDSSSGSGFYSRVDTSPSTITRGGWLPLHPLCTQVRATVVGAYSSLSVQWLVQLGAR